MELMEGWGERLTASCSSTTAPLAPRFLPQLRSVTSSRGSRASALRAFGPPAERALLESRRLTYLPPFIVSSLLVPSDTHRACAEAQTPPLSEACSVTMATAASSAETVHWIVLDQPEGRPNRCDGRRSKYELKMNNNKKNTRWGHT